MVILIVEDEPIAAISLALEVEAAGHVVIGPTATHTGALQLAREERPALALVDIGLESNENGIEIARSLQEAGIPSVFLTGQPEKARAYRSVALGLIAKPYNLEGVFRSLKILSDILEGGMAPAHIEPLELFR